jgi:steroid delta-isomerase-like uncharacterized protein
VEAVSRLLAPDGLIHNLAQDGKDSAGPAAFLTFYETFREAFPDIHIDVHETATEGEIVSGRWTATATHTGHRLGFAATNIRVTFGGMSFARVRNGQLVEGWNVWDAAGLRELRTVLAELTSHSCGSASL